MNIRVIINRESITSKITKAAIAEGKIVAYKRAESIFRRAHKSMLKDYDKHPITVEIKNGVRSIDISGATDGYANLFSFLGFESGDKPTERLRVIIDANTTFKQTVFRDGKWYFRIQTPPQEVIEKATELNWGTHPSWVAVVEDGMDNLDKFVFKKKYGRSKGGYQAPYEINEDLEFHPQPYLTEILDNFRNRIANSKNNDA